MKIFYFSKTGSSKMVAEYISKLFKSDIYELKPKFGKGSMLLTVFKKESKLADYYQKEVKNEKEIWVITPVWGGNMNSVIRGFLNKNNFKDILVNLVTVQADPELTGSKEIIEEMRSLVDKSGGKVNSTYSLRGVTPYTDKKEEFNILKNEIKEKIKG